LSAPILISEEEVVQVLKEMTNWLRANKAKFFVIFVAVGLVVAVTEVFGG